MKQLLLTDAVEYGDKSVRTVLDSVVRSYFERMIIEGVEQNYENIVIDLEVGVNQDKLYAVDRITGKKKQLLAEVEYSERAYMIISNFLPNENPFDCSFRFCLN